MSPQASGRAVVLGGSMAGLLAARVLADAYEQVTIVDRDELPDTAAARRGVPQGRHAHALLARGQQVLEQLFPGLTAELVAGGAPAGDPLRDVRMHVSGRRLAQASTGLTVLSASRPFLESHVRSRVRALPAVRIAERCDVTGLVATPDGHRVAGARVLRRAEEILGADLVIDATGRGSRAPAWLEALGYTRPGQERVVIRLGYASQMFRLPPSALGGSLASLHAPAPTSPRGGVLARIEGNRWLLTLAGVLGDHPPTDPGGFLEFARSLQFPDIYEAVAGAESLDDPVAFRFPASVRRRYDKLSRFPEGFLVLGDGVCSLNPVYGQGMSVAALHALTLRGHLQHHQIPPARPFFRDLARAARAPWEMVTGADLAFAGAEGHRTRRLRIAGAYITRLHAAAAHDANLAASFARVSGLVDPPRALLRPGALLRVLTGASRPADVPAHARTEVSRSPRVAGRTR